MESGIYKKYEEKFNRYVRRYLDAYGILTYQEFRCLLQRFKGRQTFYIAMDESYAETIDHQDSIISLCCSEHSCLCCVCDFQRVLLKTANPPDDLHPQPWNLNESELIEREYKTFLFEEDILNKFGSFNITNSPSESLSIISKKESFFIVYRCGLNYFKGQILKRFED